jgi:riboflavin kinase / FMN adenylyltransferase
VILNYSDIEHDRPTVVTIGSFDGIHLGHRYVSEQMNLIAKFHNLDSVLITFIPHPREVLTGEQQNLLTIYSEKKEISESLSFNRVVFLNFTEDVSIIDYKEFTQDLLVNRLKMKHLVFGYDHAFGKGRGGTFKSLQKLGENLRFGVSQIEPISIEGNVLSASLIRKSIESGQVAEANKYLGRPYHVGGHVISGDGRGNKLGFPTANLQLEDKRKLIPKKGVYLTSVRIGQKSKYGMTNIGLNPTFDGKDLKIEIHLFDFSEDLYQKKIDIFFHERIRDEKKFESVEELKQQLESDKAHCLNRIKNVF